MRAYKLADGSRLLSAQDAATLAGVDLATIWHWQVLGLVGAFATAAGTQYRETEIKAVAAGHPAAPGPPRPSSPLPPGTAARALRVRTGTLVTWIKRGWLTEWRVEGVRRYDADEIRALKAHRESAPKTT